MLIIRFRLLVIHINIFNTFAFHRLSLKFSNYLTNFVFFQHFIRRRIISSIQHAVKPWYTSLLLLLVVLFLHRSLKFTKWTVSNKYWNLKKNPYIPALNFSRFYFLHLTGSSFKFKAVIKARYSNRLKMPWNSMIDETVK